MSLTKYQVFDLLNRPGPLWLADADFSKAYLGWVTIDHATLVGCNFSHAVVCRATLTNDYLGAANFSNANLIGTDFSGSDLSGCNLCGADLTEAILFEVDLINATYNAATKWPAGFNLTGTGAILVP